MKEKTQLKNNTVRKTSIVKSQRQNIKRQLELMINLCTVKACIVKYVSVKLSDNKIKIY